MSFVNILFSFFVYILFLAPTVVLTSLAEKKIQRNRKKEFMIFSAAAILLPCLLAAFRGENVGTDVLVYAKPVYELAKDSSTVQAMFSNETRFETGYQLMAYISAHVFHSFHAMLFLTQFLIILPIYILAFKMRNAIPAWSTMLCFYSFFYIMTFNIMREGISVSYVLLAYYYLSNKKVLRSLVITAIGLLFHSSAVIGLMLGAFVLLLVKIRQRYIRAFLIAGVAVIIPVLLINWHAIFDSLLMLGFIPAKYAFYARRMTDSYMIGLNMAYFYKMLLRCAVFFIPYYMYTFSKCTFFQEDSFGRFIKTGIFLGLVIYTSILLIMQSGYGYRLSLYLEMLLIFWAAGLKSKVQYQKLQLVSSESVILFALVFGWFFIAYMWRGFHGTLPFYFQLFDY